ncbi:MAG TPA: hypothetical protein VF791_18575 [Pyrinomonadaceae bacterium]
MKSCRKRFLISLIVSGAALLSVGCSASRAERTQVGRKIVADSTLFPKVDVQHINQHVDEYLEADRKLVRFPEPVEESQPTIREIAKKYGNADKVINEKLYDPLSRSDEHLTVYYYGVIGFGVDPRSSDGKVIKIILGN